MNLDGRSEATTSNVRATYVAHRENMDVANASAATLRDHSIEPQTLIDAFGHGILDMSLTQQESDQNHAHRNEILSHFHRVQRETGEENAE